MKYFIVTFMAQTEEKFTWGDHEVNAKKLPSRRELRQSISQKLPKGSTISIMGVIEFSSLIERSNWRN